MRFFLGSLFGSKQELFERLLAKGKVMLHLDARSQGVRVPPPHHEEAHLRLNFSIAFALEDFMVDGRGVRASLLFGQQRLFCDLPWSAIFAMTSHVEPIGYLWPENVPSELGADAEPNDQAALQLVDAAPSQRPADHRPRRSPFRQPGRRPKTPSEPAVAEERDAHTEPDDDDGLTALPSPPPQQRHPHLRLVK